MNQELDSQEVDTGVRRVVGIAALRRLHALADAERTQDQANARAVRVIAALLGLGAALVLAFFLLIFRPG